VLQGGMRIMTCHSFADAMQPAPSGHVIKDRFEEGSALWTTPRRRVT
jgi:hypothetical protein